ncbi:hypothetical protein HPB51_005634 [Rhipicephalus microplus]|uniref:Uncharacterized protein n=1 Tax=Rhipicephalus microplus TaxID=6941 RepID=A0A9J6EM75_RHIMP|nr:hypothetical protein HPB51_005634 [Rhipicephalus microplus]
MFTKNTSLCFVTQVLTSSPEDPVHAVFVYVSGKKLGTKPAWQRAYKTILAKFHLVVGCPEFLELSADQVIAFNQAIQERLLALRPHFSSELNSVMHTVEVKRENTEVLPR